MKEDNSAMAILQKIGMEDSEVEEEKEEKEEDKLWFGMDVRTEEEKERDADGSGAPFCGRWPKRSGGDGEVERTAVLESPEGIPGVLHPEGYKPIAQVNAEFKEWRKDNPIVMVKDKEEKVKFVPALIKLALPETASEANRDLDLLESMQPPPPRRELKDIPHDLYKENGEKYLNVEWVRERVRLHKEDKQAAHTAASLPMQALNKGTQSLETTHREVFQTKCTAKEKSKFCRGYSYPDKLMPCHTRDCNGKAIGIEDKCDKCYNLKERTDYSMEDYAELAKQVRHRAWFKTDRPMSLQEMKKEMSTTYRQFCKDEEKAMHAAGYKGKHTRSGPIHSLGQEGFYLVVQELARDPLLKGPDGVEFSATNRWEQWFNAKIKELHDAIGEAKLNQLTDAMDFMRCLFGLPGKRGSIVACYLCSHCHACPKFDFIGA